MASREFLKIMGYARIGDVSAQQKLANAYLTGEFKTPIQPANALIWLEKSYFSLINQSSNENEENSHQTSGIFNQVAQIPLAKTFNSPAFGFGWDTFWHLAQSTDQTEETLAAKWQLTNLLVNPKNQDIQNQLPGFLNSKKAQDSVLSADFVFGNDLKSLQKIAMQFLQELSEINSPFKTLAKELLIKLQPKTEALSSLWNAWLQDKNLDALVQAAELGHTAAKITLGLRLAQLDGDKSKSNASLKKAAHWLELAAKDGDRDAWYALGEIYRRPQFSGYSAAESDLCFDKAADLGHAQAQLRRGANLWRKREKLEENVRGLQASYWVWQAVQQGVPEAKELLSKILESCPDPTLNDWHELAVFSNHAIDHHAEHQLDDDWLLLCHRIVIANQFNLSKAELLLCDLGQLQHEHCVVVDIRWELPKILPRLIQIETTQQRRALLAAGKVFSGVNPEIEGNLRQRRYRFDRVTQWLTSTFSKTSKGQQAPETT
jgi:uncharacterized protein